VQVCKAAIESCQLPAAASRELCQVGVGNLPVTHHTLELDLGESDTVGPELVAACALQRADGVPRSGDGLAGPKEESDKTSLCDWARR